MVKKQQQKGGQEITLSEDIVPEWPKKGLKYQLSRSFLRRCANMTADNIFFLRLLNVFCWVKIIPPIFVLTQPLALQ